MINQNSKSIARKTNWKGVVLCALFFFLGLKVYSQSPQRPFILVKSEDRAEILKKIETQQWAKDTYTKFIQELDEQLDLYEINKDKFLRGLPFNWEEAQPNQMPPFYKTYHTINGEQTNLDNVTGEEYKHAEKLITYLELASNSGIAYFLTEDENYAQMAIDILNAFVKGVLQSEVSDWHHRGGWLFPYDGFREVRAIGEKPPVIYDFIAPFIKKGGRPYDIIKKTEVDFPLEKTQKVFRTYAHITINYGQPGNNHSVLEAPNLVYNALAMEDASEREELLSFFLTKSTEHQDALNVMAKKYKAKGHVWPETSNYFSHVSNILTELMLVVNRYQPDLQLSKKYPNVLFSLPKLDYLVYPNKEIVRWGDGSRFGYPSYVSYENAYLLGLMDDNTEVTDEFGALLRRAIEVSGFQRNSMYSVLNHGAEIPDSIADFELPRTDRVHHAGLFLQRNLSSTQKPEHGLMGFVGGAHMVHGHAEGMNIELYGLGEVLGVDGGKGRYQHDIHENYYRIYAAHNTVIVNGSSQGEGGWVGLGINTVQLKHMEPMPLEKPLSPYHSYSRTSFEDDKGDKAEAYQERTLAVIRTSPTTGYYVDVFRSDSKLPDEYHDYLYHNIGDQLEFLTKDIKFKSDPQRFKANANKEWIQNGQYRNPGWHFFEGVQTSSSFSDDVKARFKINQLEDRKNRYMNLYIAGNENREYTKVKAPRTHLAPKPYNNKPTPTLVIRQKGEAWSNPFAVVYEPTFDKRSKTGIQSVSTLKHDDALKGFKVISKVDGKIIKQYIIDQDKAELYENEEMRFSFKGSYAVITFDESENLKHVYIGDGVSFNHKQLSIQSTNAESVSAFVDMSQKDRIINTTSNTEVDILNY